MILNMKNSLIPLLYTRDEDSGSITINKEGSPVVNYWPSERDVHKMINVRSLMHVVMWSSVVSWE